jgi:glucose dehydrogenase
MRYTRHPSKNPGERDTFSARPDPGDPPHGTLTAVDLATGGKHWQALTRDPLVGGVLATAGGLVFVGEGRGVLSAFHSESGEPLWEFRCGAGVNAPPVSYEVGGRQFVAVAAGGHELFRYPLGDAVVAFALPRSRPAH